MNNLVRIQDYHPNPKIRARPRKPRTYRNPVTNIVERFDPIQPLGPDGPLFYDIPAKFAEETFAQDRVGRYHLISPAEVQYSRLDTEMALRWETRKAIEVPVGVEPKAWAAYLNSLKPKVDPDPLKGEGVPDKDPDESDAVRELDKAQSGNGNAKGSQSKKP